MGQEHVAESNKVRHKPSECGSSVHAFASCCVVLCTPVLPPTLHSVLLLQGDAERDVEAWLRRKYEGRIREVEVVLKEDLDLVGWLDTGWERGGRRQGREGKGGPEGERHTP